MDENASSLAGLKRSERSVIGYLTKSDLVESICTLSLNSGVCKRISDSAMGIRIDSEDTASLEIIDMRTDIMQLCKLFSSQEQILVAELIKSVQRFKGAPSLSDRLRVLFSQD
jgi:hypothetical protein